MNKLEQLRNEIDAIDRKIVNCFEKRIDCVKQVAQYKIEHGLPVLDSSREEALLKSRAAMLKDPVLIPDVERTFQLLMKISRSKQQQLLQEAKVVEPLITAKGIVAFQGDRGANSEAALRLFFGNEIKTEAYAAFQDVFEAVQSGKAEYGVVPIENSSTGSVAVNYDLLQQYDVSIVGEQLLKIDHNLLGLSGVQIGDITDVYSHEQALLQCAGYLKELGVKIHPYYNTAVSAKFVAEQQDPSKAAIASGYAGKLYGLKTLAQDISNSTENTTRFIIFGMQQYAGQDADKASVRFVLKHTSGALAQALNMFAKCGLNMDKIESRPLEDHNFEYAFYVDFEGENIRSGMESVMAKQSGIFSSFKLLGYYKLNR